MDAKNPTAPSPRRRSRILIVLALSLMALDVARMAVLPKPYQIAFMDGFETLIAIICALSCGFAAARSSPAVKGLWAMTSSFFVLMAVADLHDFLHDITYSTGTLFWVSEIPGWCMYFSLALLIFFPVEKEGRPDWNWLPFLDFAQVTLAVGLAYFRFIHLPHILAGQPWTFVGAGELARNFLIAGGLLLRSTADPSSQARAIYRRVGGVFAVVSLLRAVLPGYVNPIFALIRPALWLLLGILAARWKGGPELEPDHVGRRSAMRLVLSLLAAVTLLVVVMLALGAPAPYRAPMHVIASISVVLFILRTSLAERSRYAAETKLRSSEQDYRVLFESATLPIVIFEPEGECILQANAAACEMYGVAPGGLIGASMKEFTKDVARGEEQIAQLLRAGACQRFESVHRSRDGREINIVVSSSIIQYRGQKAVLSFNRDVTERKEADRAREESEERLRSLVENATVGIYRTTPDGRVVMANPALVKMMGYDSFEDLAARNLEASGFEPRYPRNEFKARLEHEGEVRGLEAAWTRHDGTTIFVRESAHAVRDANGSVLFYDGIVEDVTERKQAERSVVASEALLRQLIKHTPAAVAMFDMEMRYLQVSDRWLTDYHLEGQNLIGRSHYEVFPDIPGHWKEAHRRVLAGAVERCEEDPFPRADGSIEWLQWEVRPWHKADGEIGGLAMLTQVITQRKRAEEVLVKLRQAVDASGEVVFMTDREGVITSINPEFTRLYGYTAAEVVGEATPRILKSGIMQPGDYSTFWKTILGKNVARGEVTNKTKEGRLVSVASTANPILDEQGNITGFLAIQRDMTEHKQLEEQFRQAQKMEAVGRLAGGVAHDFNNLLTVINGYSQLLLERAAPMDPGRAHLSEILTAGERAAALTRQLLAFSRKQVMEPRVLNLNSALAGMEKMLRRLIGEDVELATVLGNQLGQVKADPTQIEQAILNLAVNARDAMPRGGKITIETGNVDLDESYTRTRVDMHPGGYVMLAVSDTGHGMDAETMAHIFEPFFTTKEPGKGTGLGLSTVYGIVKQTGGHIAVYSEVGVGTTFKIYLPRLAQPVEAPPEREIATDVVGSETILVVEDETGVRSLVQKILEPKGYNVLLAGTPEEAVTLSERHAGKIDLLLTDVIMPGFSGRELADHLTFSRPEMRVLYISGYTADAIARHGVLGDKMQFLQKPFTPTALLRKLRETIEMAQ